MEDRVVDLLKQEIEIQIQLEKDLEENVPEGLQLWTLSNVEMLSILYTCDEQMLSKSSRSKEINQLLYKCKNWDKPEIERKWFHW